MNIGFDGDYVKVNKTFNTNNIDNIHAKMTSILNTIKQFSPEQISQLNAALLQQYVLLDSINRLLNDWQYILQEVEG